MEDIEKGEHLRLAPLEHWREQQYLVSQELNDLAQKHATISGGKFSVLNIDPELHPAQKIITQSVDGNPSDTETLISLGRIVNESRPESIESMIHEFIKLEDKQEYVSSLGEDLSAGQNIIVITNHNEVQDIAEALASCHIALNQVGSENNREYQFSTNIMLSKMIAHLGIHGMPVVDVLKQVCDKQYFSFPKTDSIRGTNIPEKLVTAYNWSLKQRIKTKLRGGGNLFGIAPSGTLDKTSESSQSHNQIVLAPVTDGTVEILTSANTKVLPIAILKTPDEFVFEILGIPRHMRGADDVHQMMKSIAEVLSSSSVKKDFVYSA
jgi:hypothetical protein